MRRAVLLAASAILGSVCATLPAQITLVNTATGGPPSATTTGTLHSIDSARFRIGSASCLRAAGTSNSSYLPTQAALDPATSGMGGPGAHTGFTIQWWYRPAAPTTFAYLWGEGRWSATGGTFR